MDTIRSLYIVAGLFLVIVAIPLIRMRVPPNPIYGFRVSKTLGTPDIWYKVNRYWGYWQLLIGALTSACGYGFSLIPKITLDAYALACLGMFAVLLITGVTLSIRYLKSLY